MLLSTWQLVESWFQTQPKSTRRGGRRALELTPGCVDVLESRALLTVDLSGTWMINGLPTQIQQSGNQLAFTNEFNDTVQGRELSDTQVIADGWNGLTGNVVNGNTINWANGSVWTRSNMGTPPNINGGWFIGNQATAISQTGNMLAFTNERGSTSQGRFISETRVIADGWGGLQGTVVLSPIGVPTTINWDNGSVWSRNSSSPPVLPQNWTINGMDAHVSNDGNGGLLFTNEFGGRSSGYFLSSNTVVATDWGNLHGTLNSSDTVINWANSTQWTATTSAF